MKPTSITITYQETYNLGDYSNVKPGCTVTLELDPVDDPDTVIYLARDLARKHVQEEIDNALELRDEEPRYYTGERWAMVAFTQDKITIICPESQFEALKQKLRIHPGNSKRQRRHNWLIENHATEYPDHEIWEWIETNDPLPDFEDTCILEDKHSKVIVVLRGKAEDLPELYKKLNYRERQRIYKNLKSETEREYTDWSIYTSLAEAPPVQALAVWEPWNIGKMIFVTQPDIDSSEFPEPWKYGRRISLNHFTHFGDPFEIIESSTKNTIIDLRDGNFSKLTLIAEETKEANDDLEEDLDDDESED